MGIGALCAAAAVVMGVGSAAEAATVNIVGKVVQSDYSTGPSWDHSSWTTISLPDYLGIPVDTPLRGTLSLSERLFNGAVFAWATMHIGGVLVWDFAVHGDMSGFSGSDPNHMFKWYGLDWDGTDGIYEYSSDMGRYLEYARLEFTLAPVPLPATVALLPIGIGALAMMRRRRRLFN